MKKILLAVLTFTFFVFAVSAGAQEPISKRRTCEMSAGIDDAEEKVTTGEMYLTGHLELCHHAWDGGGRDQIVGLRFPKFGLPATVVIDSAYLQFFSIDNETGTSIFTIEGDASVDSAAFTNTAYNISSRPKTAASVVWEVPAWTGWGEVGLAQRSSDVSAIVKEIVAQEGFSSESPITLFLRGAGTRTAYSFDDNVYAAPKLLINYHFPDATANTTPYRDRYAGFFPFGTAVTREDFEDLTALGAYNIFTRLTPETSMKWSEIHPLYDVYDFEKADFVANYARANNMKMTGHTLLWHQSNPEWLFNNGSDGNVSPSVLSSRLRDHIYKLIERYGDIVDNWDVVNEVISSDADNSDEIYRTGSSWWNVFNSPEFVKLAFQYAAEANAVYGTSSKLFLNESHVPDKLEKLLKAVDYLRDEGVQVDGIGFQGHWKLNEYPISQIRAAFDAIIAKDLEIKISEMDISIWNIHYNDENQDYQPPFPEAAYQEQAYYYQELFDLLREYKDHIHSVTFWGVSDKYSWLNHDWNTWEILPPDQRDAPLLFDENFVPKKAFYSIMDFDTGTSSNQQPVAVLRADATSGTAPFTVFFDGSESYDSDGDIVECNWTLGDGSSASGASVTHTYQDVGSYTAVLTVKDNLESVGTASDVVNVEPNPSNVIHVQDIAISQVSLLRGKNAARVVVLVQNMLGDPVDGVTVSGTWSGKVSGTSSGATDSDGFVSFRSKGTRKTGEITFTVNSLSKTSYQYDSSSNLMTSASIIIKL
ncbi:MAG: PKD domain-containing protein [Candidatus Electrothrix sp. ATG2]|nr:PKD domain-containing protein [Candidatus Electrothrix sp. ATG2]